jgi:hypothetical protein
MSLNNYLYEKFGGEFTFGEICFLFLIYTFVVSSLVGLFGIVKYMYYSITPSWHMELYFFMSSLGCATILLFLWFCVKDIKVIHKPK